MVCTTIKKLTIKNMSYFCKKCTNLLKKVPLHPSNCNDTNMGMGQNTIDTTGKVNMVVRCDEYDLNKVADDINEVLENQTTDRLSSNNMKTYKGMIKISAEILNPDITDASDDIPQNRKEQNLYTMKIKGEWYMGNENPNKLNLKLPQDFVRRKLY
jgi:hypothetical protein